jgi:hypothetical protein
MIDKVKYPTPYLARLSLPDYFSDSRNGCKNRPLSPLEEWIVKESDDITEQELIDICQTILELLDDPEKTPTTLQLLHGIWRRGFKVLKFHKGLELSEELKKINQEVINKALNNKLALGKAMTKWQCLNH